MRKLLSFKRMTAVAAVAALAVVSAVSVALGDNTQVNDTVTGGNVPSAAPGSAGTASVRIVGNRSPSGDVSGCNVSTGSPAMVKLSSNQSWVTFPSSGGDSVTITDCGNTGAKTVAYSVSGSAPAGATATITTSTSGGVAGSLYNDASFTITTPAAPADITGPDISFTLNPASPNGNNGWYTSAVGIDWRVSDTQSAITSSSGCDDTTVSADGVHSLTCTATSSGGTSSKTAEFKIDKTAPTITDLGATVGPDGDNGWYKSNVTNQFKAVDDLSGLSGTCSFAFSQPGDVEHVTISSEGSAVTGGSSPCSDNAGNSANSIGSAAFKIDKTAPAVNCGAADGIWYASDVSIACTAGDGGSGLSPASDTSFSLTTNVDPDTETSNALTVTKTVSDAAGNMTTAGPIGGNRVDKKGPAISCATPAPTFTVGQSPANVTGTATDGGSGTSATPSAEADTSSVVGNPKTVALSATDDVGNSGYSTCSYSVVYGFSGFFQPVDMDGVFNKSKAGSAIPVKFSLDGVPQPGSNTHGLAGASSAFMAGTTASPNPVTALVACPTSTSLVTVLEEVAADSISGLKYDPAADQWIYVWKTTTALANSCRQLRVVLADGTTKTANFQFTK
jgi:hypothetical protein